MKESQNPDKNRVTSTLTDGRGGSPVYWGQQLAKERKRIARFWYRVRREYRRTNDKQRKGGLKIAEFTTSSCQTDREIQVATTDAGTQCPLMEDVQTSVEFTVIAAPEELAKASEKQVAKDRKRHLKSEKAAKEDRRLVRKKLREDAQTETKEKTVQSTPEADASSSLGSPSKGDEAVSLPTRNYHKCDQCKAKATRFKKTGRAPKLEVSYLCAGDLAKIPKADRTGYVKC